MTAAVAAAQVPCIKVLLCPITAVCSSRLISVAAVVTAADMGESPIVNYFYANPELYKKRDVAGVFSAEEQQHYGARCRSPFHNAKRDRLL